MTEDGYPEDYELDAIRNWDFKETPALYKFIEERWNPKGYGFRAKIDKSIFGSKALKWELHTGGDSGNESLINALLENFFFQTLFYDAWKSGGHHYFEIKLEAIGFETVQQFVKANNITRQGIYKKPEKYDWIIESQNKRYIRQAIKKSIVIDLSKPNNNFR